MSIGLKDEDFKRLDAISVAMNIPRRTIEYHLSKLKKNIGDEKFSRYYKDIQREDYGAGRPIRLYHQPTIKRLFEKNAQRSTIIRSEQSTSFSRKKKRLRKSMIDMNENDVSNIVELICKIWLNGHINLLDAVEDQGISLTLFFQMVNSSKYTLQLFNTTKDKWLSTHGHHLQHLAYAKLIKKMEATHITKTRTHYIATKNKNGKRLRKFEKEIVEKIDYHPTAPDILLTKKFFDEIALLNPEQPNIVDDKFENKDIETLSKEIEQLEKLVNEEKGL